MSAAFVRVARVYMAHHKIDGVSHERSRAITPVKLTVFTIHCVRTFIRILFEERGAVSFILHFVHYQIEFERSNIRWNFLLHNRALYGTLWPFYIPLRFYVAVSIAVTQQFLY